MAQIPKSKKLLPMQKKILQSCSINWQGQYLHRHGYTNLQQTRPYSTVFVQKLASSTCIYIFFKIQIEFPEGTEIVTWMNASSLPAKSIICWHKFAYFKPCLGLIGQKGLFCCCFFKPMNIDFAFKALQKLAFWFLLKQVAWSNEWIPFFVLILFLWGGKFMKLHIDFYSAGGSWPEWGGAAPGDGQETSGSRTAGRRLVSLPCCCG